jgi:hypothetical protein
VSIASRPNSSMPAMGGTLMPRRDRRSTALTRAITSPGEADFTM